MTRSIRYMTVLLLLFAICDYGGHCTAQTLDNRPSQTTETAPDIVENKADPVAQTDEAYSTENYSFTCPTGEAKTIEVPYKTERQQEMRKQLARAASCNLIDEMNSIFAQCTAEFGNPYCE